MTQQLKDFAQNLLSLVAERDNLERELACYRDDWQEMQEASKRVRDENDILWDMLTKKDSEHQSCVRCEECVLLRGQCQVLQQEKHALKTAADNLGEENAELRLRIKSLEGCLATDVDRAKRRRTM